MKATFLDKRGSRRQAFSLSSGRQSSGGAAEIPNNSVEESWVHGVQVSADTDLAGDDFHEQSINAHENHRIQQVLFTALKHGMRRYWNEVS